MYTEDTYGNFSLEHRWYYYGCHQLTDEYGYRLIINSQTDGATVSGYESGDCSGAPDWTVQAGKDRGVNITPINAVYLAP